MGYRQESQILVTLPTEGMKAFVDKVTEEGIYRSYYPADSDTVEYSFSKLLIEALGEDDNLTIGGDEQETEVEGWVNGKVSDNDEPVLRVLASVGGVGVIDCEGEDGYKWRFRLKDGEVTVYSGAVVYDGDPGD